MGDDIEQEAFPASGGEAHVARSTGPRWLSGLGRLHRDLDWITATAVFAVLSAMSLVVLAGVISRYGFNDALSWSE